MVSGFTAYFILAAVARLPQNFDRTLGCVKKPLPKGEADELL